MQCLHMSEKKLEWNEKPQNKQSNTSNCCTVCNMDYKTIQHAFGTYQKILPLWYAPPPRLRSVRTFALHPGYRVRSPAGTDLCR